MFEEKTHSEKVENVKQAEKKTEQKLLGSIKPHPGHTLFEINVKSKTILPAEFEQEAIRFEDAANKIISNKRKLVTKADCLYIAALNQKNVKKILKRNYNFIIE